MKKLHFYYEMQLQLAGSVTNHYFRFRCLPYKEDTQTDLGSSFLVDPATYVREIADGFGNRCISGEFLGPHSSMHVITTGDVRVDFTRRSKEKTDGIYRCPSSLTVPEDNLEEFYHRISEERSRKPGVQNDVAFICALMDAVYQAMTYTPGATDVTTTASQALALGRGVCQDYSHIFICLCRMAGFYCRYAAGAMVGEGATHAWAEVWMDGFWVGFDPTNNRMADETYIKFSHGRDFRDCTVDRGRFLGFVSQQQQIYVKVEEIE